VNSGVLSALGRELAGVETGDAFARVARDVLVAEYDLDAAELVVEDDVPGLRAVPDTVPADVAEGVVGLWVAACRIEKLAHDAAHDVLTGLRNRRSFDQGLAEAVAGAQRYGWSFALVLVDLDGLKAINDEHGHAVGDAVLRAVGRELTHSVRTADVAARLGGDEFGLIVMEADAERVAELLARVTSAVNQTLTGVDVTLSAGTAHVPADGTDAGVLYRLADERLYRSKRA
jgi:diguanylate cyclase (GGDEF)-like protein